MENGEIRKWKYKTTQTKLRIQQKEIIKSRHWKLSEHLEVSYITRGLQISINVVKNQFGRIY